MTKRTVALSSATAMLLTMFSPMIDAQHAENQGIQPVLAQYEISADPTHVANAANVFESTQSDSSQQSAEFQSAQKPYAELLELSGFSEQLNKVPNAVTDSIELALFSSNDIAPFERADIPFLRQAVPAAFSTHTLYSAVIEEMQAVLSVDAVEQLSRFYSTSDGRALRDAEVNHSILEHADEFVLWHTSHGLASLTIDRQSALVALEQAMQVTQGAVDAMIGMQVAMQVSLTPVLPEDQRQSAGDLMRAAQLQRPSLTSSYHQSSLETLGFVFQAQSVEELRKYSAILDTDAGQQYVKAINNGLSRGLIRAAEDLGASIQTLLAGRLGQGV